MKERIIAQLDGVTNAPNWRIFHYVLTLRIFLWQSTNEDAIDVELTLTEIISSLWSRKAARLERMLKQCTKNTKEFNSISVMYNYSVKR